MQSMAEPKLVPGTLYIDRDQDLRTGAWGAYVKIGIVRNEKEASDRTKEHQTGNPRRIHILHEVPAPMVENLETRLHHWFAERWVIGEWFDMDEDFVNSQVIPKALEMIETQVDSHGAFENKKALTNIESDGVVREATEAETTLGAEYAASKARVDAAKAKKEILRALILDAMGEVGGMEGVVDLQRNKSGGTFDKTAFKNANETLYESFLVTKVSEPKGTLSFKTGAALSKIDKELDTANKVAAKRVKSLDVALLEADQEAPTNSVKEAHAVYVAALGELSEAEFELETIKAKLAETVGTSDGIEDVVMWKREVKETIEFDSTAFKKAHAEIYEAHLKPTTYSVKPKVSMCRPYQL